MVVAVVAAMLSFLLPDTSQPGYNPYSIKHTKICYIIFFSPFLLGAYSGKYMSGKTPGKAWINLLMTIAGVIVYYGSIYAGQRVNSDAVMSFSVLGLLIFAFYLYKFGKGDLMSRIMEREWVYATMRVVGGLCLESYLVQGFLIKNYKQELLSLSPYFPFNILMIFVIFLVCAYLLRILSRFIGQSFKSEPYDWHAMVSLY